MLRKPTFAALAILALAACDDDETAPDLRADIDYSVLGNQTPYSEQFVDEAGATTVDLADGNNRHKMFQALNYYSSSNITANTAISAEQLKKLFSNTGNPFVDISTSTISVTGSSLNSSGVQLKNVTASSLGSGADAVRTKLESDFDDIATASLSVTQVAEKGKAGKLATYLVDDRGIETIQIIQKSLIGALQLDYISNVLLSEGLKADNHSVVSGKNYSALEHNWDEAYGLLTLNPVYLYNTTTSVASTDAARATVEFGAGSYIWEYNKANYAKFYPAFLKGRAAIVNNDKAEIEAQATFIRTQMELAIARAALGYLDKWKAGGAQVKDQAHAIGEGLGFIYSLRFAKIHGGDAAWSDGIINGLVGSEFGFWDLDVTKINAASDAIKAKFSIQ
ncbi:DUF4856 domain-containing protein [Chryseolinea sp. T2]|uniref:DUF4856 domain-containing protein n=1 Tax=Chryseolinea sp. T2 TaxID=3129255 RepID=UPI003076E5D1